MLLQYSAALDVFVCVYSRATRPKGSSKVPRTTTHSVLLLEPATLRKLLVYNGPETHSLQCAHYDGASDRLVLASHLKTEQQEGAEMLPSAPRNVVEILQLSKRLDDRQSGWPAQNQQPKMLLFVENTRASLRHPDLLTLICGSKGLKELYGAARVCSGATDSTSSALLEWRQSQPNGGKFVLVKRVMLRESVTAMAVSPCGDWLLAGFCKGGLKVWNVNGSRTNGSALFTIDAEPYEPAGSGVAEAQAEVLSSIEITTTSAHNSSEGTTAETRSIGVIVIAAEKNTGAVRHWMFSVERKLFGSDSHGSNPGEHRYPKLSLVGYFHCGGKEQMGKEQSPTKFMNHDTLGPPLTTLTMCVTIDMGSCFENLLLVVREDVIHVLKIQTVLYVLQEFASIEEAFAVRAITQQDEPKVLSLSTTAACKLRIFPLDENLNHVSSSSKLLFISPHASEVPAHVSFMETISNESMQLSFVILAWSSGVVDIYDIFCEKHIMKLQDSQLTDQISALAVVNFQRTIVSKDADFDEIEMPGYFSSRSYDDDSQNPTVNLASYTSDEAGQKIQKTMIVVGTETGKLYGWNVDTLWNDSLMFQSIQKATIRVQTAHAAHIVQIARVESTLREERALLVTVGADGIVKLWQVPSLKMIGCVSSVSEGYTSSTSCIELMREAYSLANTGSRGRGKLYVSAGYDDGRLAVWRVECKQGLFHTLDVSTKHERRVSKVCCISSDTVPVGTLEFMSCSLDMTVIQWQILQSGNVQEKRYFDIGAAIVDMILVKEQVVIALAHEVCKFVFAPSSKSDMKYLMKPAVIADTSRERIEKQESSAAVDANPKDDEYPNTPTTRSVEDSTDQISTPARKTSRSVDEYLTLHVPSAVLHLEAATSSVVATDTAVYDAETRALEQDENSLSSQNDAAFSMPKYRWESKSSHSLQKNDDEILREYLLEYIGHHGTAGTMAANRITHLLALRPELPNVRRPGFALAKSLKDLKVDVHARVDCEEALQILKMLLTMSTASHSSFDAPTMARTLKQKERSREKARAQRLRERSQVRRKPVVTYNLLGEKFVRWEDDPIKEEVVTHNQSPASPTNSLVVHTPPSPNMREVTGFDDPPSYEKTPTISDGMITELPRITDHPPSAPSNSSSLFDDSSHSSIPSNDDTNSAGANSALIEPSETAASEDSVEGNDEQDDDDGNDTDDKNDRGNENHNQVQMARHAPKEPAPAGQTPKKGYRSRQAQQTGFLDDSISKNALVNGIRLSPMFRHLWSKGYCWCLPAPRLHIFWTDGNTVRKTDEHSQIPKSDDKERKPVCKFCHKRLHTLELPRSGYAPHFSRQATFDIIVEVYSRLAADAHSRLYKTSSPRKEGTSECSIYSALFEVFLTTYGMRRAVEMKLKLFFVSLCHFLPEFDAVAVFGELLGLHTPEIADEYDHAPGTLVALCVCCYSWLYSRGMVVNGDSFSGRLRVTDRGSWYKPAATDVVPAIDGTTHWQFVRIEHALLCAQDNLLYPLVSPGFLRSMMLFMQDYTQCAPTRPSETDSSEFLTDVNYKRPTWIELHRLLRLLVGEWKQQNAQFRVVERLLFLHPQRDMAIESDLLDKLQLMLSCFVFYDHERVGVMDISDFKNILSKLRYLWSDAEQIISKSSDFEGALLAIRKRFVDVNHDGQLCYLDFWVMLYIVGVKTRGLIHFHEIPSFCRDYRLEVSSELSDMVWNYMQLSCTLLLPKGLQVGKSSFDQKADRQHRRRVGGLHDGTFHITKTLKGSLSTQELLSRETTKKRGLFVDGSAPVTRQTASTTALDRFRPVSVDSGSESRSRRRGPEPVVVGVRHTGPTPKPVAPIRVSVIGNCDPPEVSFGGTRMFAGHRAQAWRINQTTQGEAMTAYTSMYIQFPQIPPVRRRIGAGLLNKLTTYSARHIMGNIPMEDDSDGDGSSITCDDSAIQEVQTQAEMSSAIQPPLARTLSSRSLTPVADIVPEETAQDQPTPLSRKPSFEKRRSATAVVVVPTVEAEATVSRAGSRHELLKRQPSRGLQRAVSERLKLEEAAALLEAEKVSLPPRQPTPVAPVRVETPPSSDGDEDQSVVGSEEESESEADDVEESQLNEDMSTPMEANDPVPAVVEEVAPAPEVPTPAQVVEPVVLQPSVEEVKVLAEVQPPLEVTDPPEQFIEIASEEVIETIVHEEAIPTPVLIEESVPVPASGFELRAESDVESEDKPDREEVQYTPQVIKDDDIQIHHAFRFSQQPTFLHSVTVTNNPYRTAMWNPDDDSEDDDDVEKSPEKNKYLVSNAGCGEGFEMDESIYSSEDEYPTKNKRGAAEPSKAKHAEQEIANAPAASQLSPSVTSTKMPKTATTLKPYSQLTRIDSNIQPTQHHKRDKQTLLEYQFSDDLESIEDQDDDGQDFVSNPLKPPRRARLDEDAERALYGGRVVNALGEGIAFSPEAEAAMQQKWQQFFDDSESKMFAAMRHDLEIKQTEQREAEERQRMLRKKWQEQRDQDLLRLQNSRYNSTSIMSTANASSCSNNEVDASFRLRRIHRESCRQLTEELQFGVSVRRELKEAKETQFFHFYYLPEGHGSIITLKMQTLRGDAEVFMSTDTKVPCGTDFMWRSSERLAKDSGEGHRIILYPHDLLKVVTAATANAAPTEQAAAIFEANASTASLRSFYPKQADATSLRVGFYLSVVALEPGTTFTLAVMSSGQKMQPSRAIQTVDYLIDRFNMLSRSFQGQSTVPFASSCSNLKVIPSSSTLKSNIVRRQSSAGNDSDTLDEEEGDNSEKDSNEQSDSTEMNQGKGKAKKDTTERFNPQELESFQHLLETLSEKKGFGSPRTASILLNGPSEEHLEFVQDEDQRLQEMHQRLSPPRTCSEGFHGHLDSISVVTERRLTLQGKRQKLRRVVAAQLQQKLAPLRHKSIAGGELEKSASTSALVNIRVAKTAPRPVAYSLTSLDPLPRSQRFKATTAPLTQTRRSTMIEKASTDTADSRKDSNLDGSLNS
ncbi:unnamed protein product [Phytophthora lilii]|uniref:Unnamed protein product n=1 Tax=Phytophthora lilii TaxID=2077276 RepID=A0A9W6TUT6_9STRA|nr:unnamed protein product [Phytophthora lilii]